MQDQGGLNGLILDLRYRLGMAKARAGDKAGATAVADAFAKQAKESNAPGTDARAAAIRTVLSGDPARYDQDARKVTLKAVDELLRAVVQDKPVEELHEAARATRGPGM